MKIPGKESAKLLFDFVIMLLNKEQYIEANSFLDSVSPAEEQQYKKSVEPELKKLFSKIISAKTDEDMNNIKSYISHQPLIFRAYLVCWFGEMSGDLQSLDGIDIEYPYTAQNILKTLLSSARPFWH